MKGDPNFVILKHPAWLDARFEDKILGAIVRYPLKPSNEYVPESPLRYNEADLAEGVFADFVHENASTESAGVSAGLESLAGFTWHGRRQESARLRGKLLRCRRLQQHAQFWARLRTDEAVARSVPAWISLLNTWPPCLVVGIMTAEDVEVGFASASETQRQAELQAPVAAVASAAAGVPVGFLPGGFTAGDPHVAVESGRGAATMFSASTGAARRHIFALELRVVTTRFLRNRELRIKEGGPKVEPGRLADGDGESEGEDVDEVIGVEDLVLEEFTGDEYDEMY